MERGILYVWIFPAKIIIYENKIFFIDFIGFICRLPVNKKPISFQ